ncbi:putative NAD binding NADP oxidoreductase coenzyme F420-dependent [Aspergillus caelatus]|uniref:Putative NAD binding NADP oxidoreductase coenzyme F420-dependent n=1 Tax=Aspergillus caelatus TaxID=61420 RepID=A0A5N6ZJ96_9EURO|nr:putative NAD binding NADP oxidoreductase coenzyme F420-dependent [Aspergillus caelatus]KAE8357303.1 putative NAD binding NADP oxidoreductase coenzyme F420-dependent [Aspergillus caelatus]
MRVGFLGLGVMGTPMARNLSRKFPLIVWNRSAAKYSALKEEGVTIGESPTSVVKQSDIIFIMLFDAWAIKSILSDDFKRALRGKTLINTSSVSVEFSMSLAEQIHQGGGDFIEMPVSGSKVPAEKAQLVGMMAGDAAVAQRIKQVVEPITRAAIFCGPIGSGLKAKYAVNTLLVTYTVGLAESMNLARAQGIDLAAFAEVLDACPMASAYSKIKVQKILNEDWSPQATLKDCYNSTQLIQNAVKLANTRSPSMAICDKLYQTAVDAGLSEEDMISIAKVIETSQI